MRQDIIHNDGELLIKNGDFVIDESDRQHVEDIIEAVQGEFKGYPYAGFGAVLQLKKNTNDSQFKRDLKIQLEYDGYKSAKIDLSEGYERIKIEI
ncbi:MAG: hypothetical protein H3C36_02205 [Chitinophagaceae bacterium]|nr:hypothetical protein [Chitinophagaceae bacterium]